MLCERCAQVESESTVILGTLSLGDLCYACRKALVEPFEAVMREVTDPDPKRAETAFREHPKVRRVAAMLGHEPSAFELVDGLSRLGP